MSFIVSEKQPPCISYGIAYWERSSDPWHPEAFANADLSGKTLVKLDSLAMEILGGDFIDQNAGPRKQGWMAIDSIENPIGFVSDGTEINEPPQTFEYKTGPCGHLCAYPIENRP